MRTNMKKTIILILILISGLCSAANLVMLIGGDGDQTGTTYPCIADKQAFEDGEVTDFMDANGLPKVTVSSAALTYGATSSFIAGDFSDANNGAYAYVYFGVADPNNGYYDIEDSNSTALKIATTNIDNVAIDADDTVDVYIGGAGVNLASAVARMADIDLSLGHNVDVLTNKSESGFGANLNINANGSALGSITYEGRTYDSTIANNNYTQCISESAFPAIDVGTYSMTVVGLNNRVKSLTITGNSGTVVMDAKVGTYIERCYIYNSSTSVYASAAVNVTAATILNSHVKTVGGASELYGAITLYTGAVCYGCFVEAAVASGISTTGNYSTSYVLNNLVVANSSNSRGGIYLPAESHGQDFVFNNTVYGFKYGIHLASPPPVADEMLSHFMNNILWGDNVSGGLALYNGNAGTIESTFIFKNNYQGNFAASDNHSVVSLEWGTLLTNPFKNGSGNMNVASDFWLTDAAKLICKAKPTDFDLDGTDDNFQAAGAITEQVTSSGTSAGSISITEN